MPATSPRRIPHALGVAIAVALVAGCGHETPPSRGAPVAVTPEGVSTIARDVERIRELRFRRLPRPRLVTSHQARREGLAELDRGYPPARRRADEETLKLLGLLEPADDLRTIGGSVFSEEVVGYYDTRRDRLALVEGSQPDDPVLAELTLAHELVHALEDQRFDLKDPAGVQDDGASARTALIEGTATEVMLAYSQREIDPRRALGSALTSAFAGSDPADLPPYVRAALEFGYVGGQRFVQELLRAAGGWKLVDSALRFRPPASTEQIIHPVKYMADERPERVRLDVRRVLGRGWRREAVGTVGEFDTAQILGLAGPRVDAQDASAGWGGGDYELWRRRTPPAADCASPCASRYALALGWRWDTVPDAEAFERALPAYLERGLGAQSTRAGSWELRGGAAAVSTRGLARSLAFAPSARLAERLAAHAAGG